MGTWLMLGGRGTGKTEGGARYLNDHMNGPPCDRRIKGGHRTAIVAPTLGDAAESCVTGPSGIQTINPSVVFKSGKGGQHLIWPNGGQARIFGAFSKEDIERLRAGGNRCLVWLEESAAIRFLDQALEHTTLGLRIGHNPHFVMSTTPKPRKEIKDIVASHRTVLTKGSTRDAIHLDPEIRKVYFEKYEGTRLGRQELDAEMLDDVEGALWALEMIDADRVPEAPLDLDAIVIGVDPAGSSDDPSRETGIIVVGVKDGIGYVLADFSGTYTPDQWGRMAVKAYHQFDANAIIAETNYGGEMVKNTIRTQDSTGAVPIIGVNSRRGKVLRAEPVVSLYEQHKVRHVGVLTVLETQQTEWIPNEQNSPDRIDALVHAVTFLMVKAPPVTVGNPARSARRVNGSVSYPGSRIGAMLQPTGIRPALGPGRPVAPGGTRDERERVIRTSRGSGTDQRGAGRP
jgi:phage terminase large subunit-like protein